MLRAEWEKILEVSEEKLRHHLIGGQRLVEVRERRGRRLEGAILGMTFLGLGLFLDEPTIVAGMIPISCALFNVCVEHDLQRLRRSVTRLSQHFKEIARERALTGEAVWLLGAGFSSLTEQEIREAVILRELIAGGSEMPLEPKNN